MSHVRSLLVCLAATAVAGLAQPAHAAPQAPAANGVVEINQDKALAGNVTPGDTAGFPVTLGARGSYRLTSNLMLPNGNVNGVNITADDVTLDLNGFAIVGPGCSGTPLVCNGSGAGVVSQEVRSGVTVRNGTVRGMPSGAVWIGSGSAEKLQIIGNGQGLTIRRGSATDNVVQGNAGLGIWVYEAGRVVGNHVLDNASVGLFMSRGAWGQNVLIGNNGGSVQAEGGTAMGPNYCQYALCP
jgi:hypothetical protein